MLTMNARAYDRLVRGLNRLGWTLSQGPPPSAEVWQAYHDLRNLAEEASLARYREPTAVFEADFDEAAPARPTAKAGTLGAWLARLFRPGKAVRPWA